jgi:transcriptional regulator GlxA family with amidase domain
MRVSLLVLESCFDSGLSIVRDGFEAANLLAAAMGLAGVRFEVTEVGVRRRVRTHHGRTILPASAARGRKADLVVVPGIATSGAGELAATLERADLRDAADALGGWHAAGVSCAAACSSTFLLGDAGLLDGGAATTTWWLAPLFRSRFPRVELDETRMVVDAGDLLTAGAAMAHLDAVLAIIRRRSPDLARATAEHLVVDARPSQAPYIVPSHLSRADPLVERFERWVRPRLRRAFSMGEAARAVGASERTLERRVRDVLGRTPIGFVQDLRLERAVHLLRTTDGSLEEISASVGYENATTLGTLLRKRLGAGAREIRDRAPGRG